MVLEEIVEQIIGTMDIALAPLLVLPPHVSLLLVSAMLSGLIIFLNRITTNQKVTREIKMAMEEIKEQLARAQKEGRKELVDKFLKDMMKANKRYMTHTMKALVISLVVLALFLPWIRHTYEGAAVALLPFALPLVGSSIDWIVWYIMISFSIGWIIRKLLGME